MKLIDLMKKHGLTPKSMADATGLAETRIYRICVTNRAVYSNQAKIEKALREIGITETLEWTPITHRKSSIGG